MGVLSSPAPDTAAVALDRPRPHRDVAPILPAALLGGGLLLLFCLLGTRDYTGVDGAVRCLEVYHRHEVFFHGNNHLLYPVSVYSWHRVLGFAGLVAESPIAYLELTQKLVAAAAAGCCVLVFVLCYMGTRSVWASCLAALALALTHGFLLHATSSAEPMPGLFLGLLATVLAVRSAASGRLVAFVAGLLFALAVACYQSMALMAISAMGLVFAPSAGRIGRCVCLAAGGALGASMFFGLPYHLMGITGLLPKLSHFFSLVAPEVFGRPSLSKLAHLPLAYGQVVTGWLPAGFLGLRSVLTRAHAGQMAIFLLGVLSLLCATAAASAVLWRRRHGLAPEARLVTHACLLGVALTLFGPAVWDSYYEKLWLAPLAYASVLSGVAGFHSRARSLVLPIAGGGLVAVVNLSSAVAAHKTPTPYLDEARVVAGLTGDDDLVVHGWDRVSVLYAALWGEDGRRHRFDFTTRAVELRGSVGQALNEEVDATLARRGNVYFVGILDSSPNAWSAFLGGRTGVPFETLAPYRQCAHVVRSFAYAGKPLPLFRLADSIACRRSDSPDRRDPPQGAPGLSERQVANAATARRE